MLINNANLYVEEYKMKKYGLAVLTLTLVLSVAGLSGCKSGSDTDSGNGSSYDTGDAELDEALSKVEKYDAASLVELGIYKGVEVDTSVTQDDIDGAIMNLLSENTTVKKIKKGKVKEGDTVNIDFTGKMDGKEFEGGSAQSYSLEIGSNSFIEGFEEGLIGLSVGDSTSLDLTFPDPYPNNTDYAGKPVVFDVTINYINGETVVPEYNDEFINTLTNGEYTSADDYTEKVIKPELVKTKQDSMGETAFQKVLSTSKVSETPDYLVNIMKMRLDASYKAMADSYGYTDFSKFLSESWQMSKEQYDEQINTTAVSYVEQKLIAEAIAVKEGIEVTEEEYNKYLSDYKTNMQIDSDEELEKYVVETYKSRVEDLINEAIISQKVIDFVKENAVATDGTSNEEDSENE